MKAMKHANLNMNRYPGLKNSDVFYQMIDLDKGVYGHAFLVSLFIHVNDLLDDYAEICFGEGGFLIISEGGTGENRSYVTHLNFRVGPIFYAIFSNIWEKISSYSPKISKKKLVTPLDKIRSALTESGRC